MDWGENDGAFVQVLLYISVESTGLTGCSPLLFCGMEIAVVDFLVKSFELHSGLP